MSGPVIRTVVATVLAASWITYSEAARQCVVFVEPSDYFERSDVVFLGTVVSTKPTGAQGHHIVTDIATFDVERIWKGPTQSQFTVGDDRPFMVGGRYIVFAGGKPLSTAMLCGWAELEETAEKKLRWLETKPSRRPNKAAPR